MITDFKKYNINILDKKVAFSLANDIRLKLKYPDKLKFLSTGGNGTSFLCDDFVIKLTNDKSEYIESSKILRKKNKHIADVYDIYKLVDTDIYIIIREYLLPNKNISKFEDLMHDWFNEHFEADYGYFSEWIYEYHINFIQDKVYQKVMNSFKTISSIELKNFIFQFMNMVKEISKNNIQSHDYDAHNLGYKKNGNLAYFDLGYGDVNKKIKYKLLSL